MTDTDWQPSEIELGRRRWRRAQTRRSVLVSVASTLVFAGVLAWAVLGSPGWAKVAQMFLDPQIALASLPRILEGLWLNIQVLVFAVVSVVLLVAVRPWALRVFRRSVPETLTNVAAHVGRPAVVVMDVSAHAGRVKLAGEVWTARSADPAAVLPVGTSVRVVRIDGATAVVEPAPPGPVDDTP